MNISEAINRLSFTVSKQNRPNENDAIALNEVISYFNKQNKSVLKDNQLLAKMFVIMINDSAVHNGSIDLAIRQLNEVLKTESLLTLCTKLSMDLNLIELNRYANTNSEIDAQKFIEVVNWDLKRVISNVEVSVNELLNNNKNNE